MKCIKSLMPIGWIGLCLGCVQTDSQTNSDLNYGNNDKQTSKPPKLKRIGESAMKVIHLVGNALEVIDSGLRTDWLNMG